MCSSKLGLSGIPAMSIYNVGHWLQMSRIHATCHPAKMINFKSLWDWSSELFVRKTVGTKIARCGFCAYFESPVSTTKVTCPEPASRIRLRMDVEEKAFQDAFEGKLIISHAARLLLHRLGLPSGWNRFVARNTILSQVLV